MFLVHHIIVKLIQYCQKWRRIGKKLGQNGGGVQFMGSEAEQKEWEQNL